VPSDTVSTGFLLCDVAGFGDDDRNTHTQKLRALFEKWKETDQKRQEAHKKYNYSYDLEATQGKIAKQVVAVLREYAQVEGDASRREMIAREVAKLAARTEIRHAHYFSSLFLLPSLQQTLLMIGFGDSGSW
jgi:hypothetical protein